MFRNIMVAVDGTAPAEAAVPWALAAAAPGAAVHLVHAHRFPPLDAGMVCDPTLDQALLVSEGRYLDELAYRSADPKVTILTHNVDVCSDPAEALGATARAVGADLVVMATHGRGPLARFVLGSVGDQFVRLSPAPVLFVRRYSDEVNRPEKPRLEHLVVPLDESHLAERILVPAVALGSAFGAGYTLVRVVDPSNSTVDDPKAYLDRIARSVPGARREVVRNRSAAQAILAAAGQNATTGIALATHGRAGVGRLLHGSVADEVIHRAAGPVLVFHPTDENP